MFISMYLYYDYYVNFDWCRKVHSRSCSGTRLACTHARSAPLGKIFPRSRRGLDTAEKSSHEQQALLEYTRTACSMFHGTWCGFDRSIKAAARVTGVLTTMHAFSISDDLIP